MDSKPRASVSAKNAPRVPGTSRDKAKKSSKRHNSRKEDPSSKKKHKRKGDKDGLTTAGGSKKKRKNESGSTLSAYTDDDTSDEEAAGETTGYPKLPEVRIWYIFIPLICIIAFFSWQKYITSYVISHLNIIILFIDR